MLKQILVSAMISLVSVLCYHAYLKHTGHLNQCVRGVYTVNLSESIDALRKMATKKIIAGEKVDPHRLISRVQNSINKLAQKLPDGYLMVPESCVIAGKRKKINLLNGSVKETREAEKLVGK